MIRLAAFDIDRTLVSQTTHTIAPETVEALRELQRRGIKTAIATGRQWQQVPKALKALNFDITFCSTEPTLRTAPAVSCGISVCPWRMPGL